VPTGASKTQSIKGKKDKRRTPAGAQLSSTKTVREIGDGKKVSYYCW